jgi:hypothetical protein
MTELTSLRLFVDSTFSSAPRPVNPSTFSNLLNVSTSLAFYDQNVALCLAETKSLLEVDFDSLMDVSPDLPAGSLPRPRSFTAPARVADAIVPSRPIEFIQLNTGTILETVAVKPAKSPVTLFEASINSLSSIPSLLSLSQMMPHLQNVRFTTSDSVEPPSHVCGMPCSAG